MLAPPSGRDVLALNDDGVANPVATTRSTMAAHGGAGAADAAAADDEAGNRRTMHW